MTLSSDNIILIDKERKPLGFLSKSEANSMELKKWGLYRTDFLFQLNEILHKDNTPYNMYVDIQNNKEDRYNVSIKSKEADMFDIGFNKLANVKNLSKYINVENIYFNKIDDRIIEAFKEVDCQVQLLSSIIEGAEKPITFSNEGNINKFVKEIPKLGIPLPKTMEAAQPLPETLVSEKLYKIYRYKFYLDAKHSIKLNGNNGEAHPHTWEFLIEVKDGDGGFIPFATIEHLIDDLLKPYQNKYINDIKPFNETNPTTENIGDYFHDLIKDEMEDKGLNLVQFEISESPNRTYILNNDNDYIL
jgi:6-pyruvoyltetrahydropterin/6-carboxytetrahydropterin synthase